MTKAKRLLLSMLVLSLASGCTIVQLQTTSTGLLLADWRQTQEIASDPNLHENNLILGKHPSSNAVNGYFATVVAANLVVGEVLPERQAKWYYTAIIVLESWVVNQNINLGVRF